MTETDFDHLPLCDWPVPAAEVIKDMHMEDVNAAQLADAIGVSASTIRGAASVAVIKCNKDYVEA